MKKKRYFKSVQSDLKSHSKGERLGWPKLSKKEENERLLNTLVELESKENPTEDELERIETLHYMLREESEDV